MQGRRGQGGPGRFKMVRSFFTFQPQRGVLFGSPLAGSMVWCDRVREKVASHLATIVNDLIRIDSIL